MIAAARRIVMAGYGAVGRALAERLSDRGNRVLVVQRHVPSTLPANCTVRRANFEDAEATQAALAEADSVACAPSVPTPIYTRVG